MEGDRSRTQMVVVAQGEAMKMCCTGGCAGDKGDCCEDTGVCFVHVFCFKLLPWLSSMMDFKV